jgi:hypothetical protein
MKSINEIRAICDEIISVRKNLKSNSILPKDNHTFGVLTLIDF